MTHDTKAMAILKYSVIQYVGSREQTEDVEFDDDNDVNMTLYACR